jgi:hypothetical protein
MHRILAFLYDDTGAVTIEFVTLVPIFVLLLVFFTDASIIYLTRTEMWNTARDISRRMATDELNTQQEILDYAASHLFLAGREYSISADLSAGNTLTITVPLISAAIFGTWLEPLIGETLSVSATMASEPYNFIIGDPLG